MEFDFETRVPPRQLEWCGQDSVVAYWDQLGQGTDTLVMVGPGGKCKSYSYLSRVVLRQEPDGLRIVGQETHDFLQVYIHVCVVACVCVWGVWGMCVCMCMCVGCLCVCVHVCMGGRRVQTGSRVGLHCQCKVVIRQQDRLACLAGNQRALSSVCLAGRDQVDTIPSHQTRTRTQLLLNDTTPP